MRNLKEHIRQEGALHLRMLQIECNFPFLFSNALRNACPIPRSSTANRAVCRFHSA